MGFHQLRLIGNGTDLDFQQKTCDPWSARTTPPMLREREREREIEREREREREREIEICRFLRDKHKGIYVCTI